MTKIQILDKRFRLMIPHSDIVAAVVDVANRINRDYKDAEEAPVLLCILNGSIPFCAELMKHLDFDPQLVSMRIKSYSGTSTTGNVQLLQGVTSDLKGRDVIVCEDIVDTGLSMQFTRKYLAEVGVRSMKVCTLLLKPEQYGNQPELEYVGIRIPNEFIVGFGLDYNEYGRKYEDIYVLDK